MKSLKLLIFDSTKFSLKACNISLYSLTIYYHPIISLSDCWALSLYHYYISILTSIIFSAGSSFLFLVIVCRNIILFKYFLFCSSQFYMLRYQDMFYYVCFSSIFCDYAVGWDFNLYLFEPDHLLSFRLLKEHRR